MKQREKMSVIKFLAYKLYFKLYNLNRCFLFIYFNIKCVVPLRKELGSKRSIGKVKIATTQRFSALFHGGN